MNEKTAISKNSIKKVVFVLNLGVALVLLMLFALYQSSVMALAETTTVQPLATYVVLNNTNGSYDIKTSDNTVVATNVELGSIITKIDEAASTSGVERNIQFGDGTQSSLNIGDNFIKFSNGEYKIFGRLSSSSSQQCVFVDVGAIVSTFADIEALNGYGIRNDGQLVVESGTISSKRNAISNLGKLSIRGNPSFVVSSASVATIRVGLGNEIIDGGYIGSTIITLTVDSLSVNSPDPATFVIVRRTEGVTAPDASKWQLLNRNFDIVSSPYEDSKGSLISKKFYNITYKLISNNPIIYLNGYKPIEKAYPGDSVILPTRCEVSLTGDNTYYSLHGWYVTFDNSLPDPYIGDPITTIDDIRRDWTVYAKFSDTPPNQPPCPTPDTDTPTPPTPDTDTPTPPTPDTDTPTPPTPDTDTPTPPTPDTDTPTPPTPDTDTPTPPTPDTDTPTPPTPDTDNSSKLPPSTDSARIVIVAIGLAVVAVAAGVLIVYVIRKKRK